MTARTDDQLLQGFQNGDKSCFEELVYRYKNSLYQYIAAMVRDDGAAGDIFQEVFLNFYRRIADYRAEGKFKSYLFTSARNRILNYFRDRAKLFSLDDTDEEGNPYLHDETPGKDPLPLDGLERAETAEKIRQAVLQLPPNQREVIYLKEYMTFKEIAQLTGRPLGTVLAEHHRGIQKMQKILSKEV